MKTLFVLLETHNKEMKQIHFMFYLQNKRKQAYIMSGNI
jgi:hypothetical protein